MIVEVQYTSACGHTEIRHMDNTQLVRTVCGLYRVENISPRSRCLACQSGTGSE